MEVKDVVMIKENTSSNDADIVRCMNNKWFGIVKEINDRDSNDGIVVTIPKSISGVDPKFGDVGNKDIRIGSDSLIIVDSELFKKIK